MKVKKIKNKSEYEIVLKLNQDEFEALQLPIYNCRVDDKSHFNTYYAQFEVGDYESTIRFILTIKKLHDEIRDYLRKKD